MTMPWFYYWFYFWRVIQLILEIWTAMNSPVHVFLVNISLILTDNTHIHYIICIWDFWVKKKKSKCLPSVDINLKSLLQVFFFLINFHDQQKCLNCTGVCHSCQYLVSRVVLFSILYLIVILIFILLMSEVLNNFHTSHLVFFKLNYSYKFWPILKLSFFSP